MRTYPCPIEGCKHTALPFVLICEEAIIPVGKPLSRKPKALMRNFSVICPDHGEQWFQKEGHHVSTGSKKKRN